MIKYDQFSYLPQILLDGMKMCTQDPQDRFPKRTDIYEVMVLIIFVRMKNLLHEFINTEGKRSFFQWVDMPILSTDKDFYEAKMTS